MKNPSNGLPLAGYLLLIVVLSSLSSHAQQGITSIQTDNIVQSLVTHSNTKGAGLRNGATLISSWDSTGTYTVRFNAPATANILRLRQFSVGSFSSSAITLPVDATVKLRRLANTDVGDARNYYNFWAQYSSTPNPGDSTGTFDFTAPEVTSPESAFVLNNLTSGYDNIFQNTIASPHFGNIERVDFIVSEGLQCFSSTDLAQSGVAVIDRGTGDPFKIAAITAINASGDPTSFGSLISVTAANFGGNLLAAAFNYGIMINDSKYYSQSRPSTRSSQNLRGVYISLADLGLTIGQRFYGYALFGSDVTTANPDWTTYPNNSNNGSQLDPVNIMGLYKTAGSALPIPVRFTATREENSAKLDFTLFNEFTGDHLIVQHSTDQVHFSDLKELQVRATGSYTFTDENPGDGTHYYRLKMVDKTGAVTNSQTRMLKFENTPSITIYPNPVTSKLNIQLPSSWSKETISGEIFTNSGQLVKNISFDRPDIKHSIIVSSLQPGTYLLRLTRSADRTVYRQSFSVK